MNQEFYISVTPVRGDEYWVRTERVSPGVPLAEELVTWQVEEWLEQARHLMHDPLLGILRGRMRSGQLAMGGDGFSSNLVELGQTLYNALFQGTIRDSWMTAQGIAQNRREGLRLRLGLKGDRLPRLPWEVLYAGARPLATGTDVVFSRYQAAFAPMGTILQPHRSIELDPNQPLRILMVLAAPTDQEVLELRREADHLRDELQRDRQTNGEIDLTILDQPGREQLTQALEQGHYQVLHYAGHSNLGMSGGDLYLVSDRTGLTEVLSGDDLAGLLVNNGVRMAVFNSCRGVYTATADPANETESSNLTEALLKRGMPAVLAMAERIPDDVALTLSRLFYRNLRQRSPIDLSLSRARQGLLSSYGSDQLYWALPILYLHPDFDGYLQPAAPTPLADSLENSQLVASTFSINASAIGDPLDLEDESFSNLDFDEPEDSDRQAILEMLREIRDPEENPFLPTQETQPFFESLSVNTDESQLHTAEDCLTLGRLRAQNRDFSGAVVAYGRAIELDPHCAEAFSEMGTALEQLGSPTEAIVAYKMALQYEPSLSDARRHLQRLEAAHHLAPTQQVTPPTAPTPDLHVEDIKITEEPIVDRIFGTRKSRPARRHPWLVLGISGAVAAVLGVVGFSAWRASTPPPSQLIDAVRELDQPVGANPSRANILVSTATRSFAQGDLRSGQDAIEELLSQGQLAAADSAFQNVPPDKLDNPAVAFLRGRIAWQSVQQRKSSYSLDDAQNYFETALKGNRTPQVLNALGFVYYSQGNADRAGRSWLNAAKLAREIGGAAKREELTAQAGLALAFNKEAQTQKGNARNQSRQRAVALRDRVSDEAPEQFQIKALSQNWYWSESAIADWRKLMAIK
ncbi:CHAT domain-containing protein [Cyanobacteria bacterium FACHB-DQ100]|uniref:CHAT domain-containing protein n=1 Tax=Leptolyngbya sp. DQ-M1 TaxID=2933920 RepID=UPI00199E2A1B|nr:CHAT domain-containing protein [Cyanobacteria bacterium FACHB-DQ100]